MTRRTAVTAFTGALLLGGLTAPALADPLLSPSDDRETVCVRTDDGEQPERRGICVWVPLPR